MDTKYIGISHHDVAVTWWKEVLKYDGFSNEPVHQHIAGRYTRLLRDDIKGPSIPFSSVLPPVISTISDPFIIKSTKETCLNYDTHSITLAMRQFHFTLSGTVDDAFVLFDDSNHKTPCNTQQETTTYKVKDRMTQEVNFLEHLFANQIKNNTPYSDIVPLAKEFASLLDGNCSMDELKQYKEMLLDCIVKKKDEAIRNQSGKQSKCWKNGVIKCSIE